MLASMSGGCLVVALPAMLDLIAVVELRPALQAEARATQASASRSGQHTAWHIHSCQTVIDPTEARNGSCAQPFSRPCLGAYASFAAIDSIKETS
jgi:hypothetical protein